MNLKDKWFNLIIGIFIIIISTSCVDEIKFGNTFLDKAASGTVTEDTVFDKAKYAEQFLTGIYADQYYGLPYVNSSSLAWVNNPYVGKFECLSDCWQNHWTGAAINSQYYAGAHTANYGSYQDKFDYLHNKVWEAVRAAWIYIENVDKVPDMTIQEKTRTKAEAECLIAARYYDAFRHYGGLPIIRKSFSGTDASYDLPRGTVEQTVDFMDSLLNKATPNLPWCYSGDAASDSTGHWTKAAALALKCKIFLFAASPLFNSSTSYYSSSTDKSTWYGGYKSELWDSCKVACEEFFKGLNTNGYYALEQASGTRPSDYRAAYRNAYENQESTEVLLRTTVTTTDAFKSSYYTWHAWCDNGRMAYCPTEEYVEMFPWADGTPFNWDETEKEGNLDKMFTTGTVTTGITLTRDPRLYEEVIVNGMQKSLDWDNGNMSGTSYELWVGGTDALQNSANETGYYATGYGLNKFYDGNDMLRQYTQWPYLRLSDIYLTYAEALCQTGDLQDAINQVDIVRKRVGLTGLVKCNPSENLTTNSSALLNEILRERACELGMEDSRFFDMIRYKMQSEFQTPLHGLLIYRQNNGQDYDKAWYNGDRSSGAAQPTHFRYVKFVLANPTRYWWTNGFDAKWYLSPFEETEVNKGYGLTQNPGW